MKKNERKNGEEEGKEITLSKTLEMAHNLKMYCLNIQCFGQIWYGTLNGTLGMAHLNYKSVAPLCKCICYCRVSYYRRSQQYLWLSLYVNIAVCQLGMNVASH